MLLKLDNPQVLSEGISVMSELVVEVKAKITRAGLSITAIDPANVALINLKIPAAAFSQFNLEKDEEVLGLNLQDLKAVLRRATAGSKLTLETKDGMLNLAIQDTVKRSFSLALIDLEQEERTIPQLEFENKVEMDSSAFSEAITDAVIVSDACSFVTSKAAETFVIDASGTLNKSRSEFGSDEAKLIIKDGKAKYSLEYLQKFAKAAKIADKVQLQFSNDYPCRIDFRGENIEVVFILAPRVESNED
jgi:proliferating cell nuclear antigen